MSIYDNKPPAFFDIVIHDPDRVPGLTGACAGYEGKKFRNDDLAEHLFEWLPDFAMKFSELEEFNSGTSRRMLRRAAKTVYTTEKYGKRGEFGELLLHALLREVFNSQPAISKIFYKSATNETVKGFDAVHVVEASDGPELWLGEVKFYSDATSAIYDITKEIVAHTDLDYLKNEFILIGNKIDEKWDHAGEVHSLINGTKSLDDVFTRVCIPALLSYESKSVAEHEIFDEKFRAALTEELEGLHAKFCEKELPEVRIHLFLVPLHQKTDLVKILHDKLEGMQR